MGITVICMWYNFIVDFLKLFQLKGCMLDITNIFFPYLFFCYLTDIACLSVLNKW